MGLRLPADYPELDGYVRSLTQFLSEFQWLSSIHAYDSLSTDFWGRVWPAEWRRLADDGEFSAESMIALVKDGTVVDSWPSSLKRFAAQCRSLALPRNVIPAEFSPGVLDVDAVIDQNATTATGMSRKKLHEVERFSNVISDFVRASSDAGSSHVRVVDVGAGQGYLTHRLSAEFPCVAVDFDQIQTVGSVARGQKIQKGKLNDVRKGTFDEARGDSVTDSRKEVIYRTIRIDAEKLTDLLRDLSDESDAETCTDFMLVGLHACGDLSATAMIKTFEACDSVQLMAVVPCCFNLLTEPEDLVQLSLCSYDRSREYGFPMSKDVADSMFAHNLSLGHKARNLSCQNFDRFDAAGIECNLTGHYKRSLLDALLWHFNLEPKAKAGTITSLPTSSNEPRERKQHKFRLGKLPLEAFEGDFVAYATAALDRLGLAGCVAREEILAFTQLPQFVNAKRQIFVVHCVKSLLSRVLESLVLMDRYLAIIETGARLKERKGIDVECRMLNLFDIGESPRNMVFLVRKQQ
ncbi:methyltransferase domain-containing protein [Chytriomyces sp. MP71]|nr:methyltransferase domain-containing protein [Chytriomyces sp. MP71]